MIKEYREIFMKKLRREQRHKIVHSKRLKSKKLEEKEEVSGGSEPLERLKMYTAKMLEYLKHKDNELLKTILDIHAYLDASVMSLSTELLESNCLQSLLLIFNQSQISSEPIILKKMLDILLNAFVEDDKICEKFFEESPNFKIVVILSLNTNPHFAWYGDYLKLISCLFESSEKIRGKFLEKGFEHSFLADDSIKEQFKEDKEILLEYLRLLQSTVKPSKPFSLTCSRHPSRHCPALLR